MEAQLRVKMLEACCEEIEDKLAKEETQAMEEAIKGRRVRCADSTERMEATQDHDHKGDGPM